MFETLPRLNWNDAMRETLNHEPALGHYDFGLQSELYSYAACRNRLLTFISIAEAEGFTSTKLALIEALKTLNSEHEDVLARHEPPKNAGTEMNLKPLQDA